MPQFEIQDLATAQKYADTLNEHYFLNSSDNYRFGVNKLATGQYQVLGQNHGKRTYERPTGYKYNLLVDLNTCSKFENNYFVVDIESLNAETLERITQQNRNVQEGVYDNNPQKGAILSDVDGTIIPWTIRHFYTGEDLAQKDASGNVMRDPTTRQLIIPQENQEAYNKRISLFNRSSWDLPGERGNLSEEAKKALDELFSSPAIRGDQKSAMMEFGKIVKKSLEAGIPFYIVSNGANVPIIKHIISTQFGLGQEDVAKIKFAPTPLVHENMRMDGEFNQYNKNAMCSYALLDAGINPLKAENVLLLDDDHFVGQNANTLFGLKIQQVDNHNRFIYIHREGIKQMIDINDANSISARVDQMISKHRTAEQAAAPAAKSAAPAPVQQQAAAAAQPQQASIILPTAQETDHPSRKKVVESIHKIHELNAKVSKYFETNGEIEKLYAEFEQAKNSNNIDSANAALTKLQKIEQLVNYNTPKDIFKIYDVIEPLLKGQDITDSKQLEEIVDKLDAYRMSFSPAIDKLNTQIEKFSKRLNGTLGQDPSKAKENEDKEADRRQAEQKFANIFKNMQPAQQQAKSTVAQTGQAVQNQNAGPAGGNNAGPAAATIQQPTIAQPAAPAANPVQAATPAQQTKSNVAQIGQTVQTQNAGPAGGNNAGPAAATAAANTVRAATPAQAAATVQQQANTPPTSNLVITASKNGEQITLRAYLEENQNRVPLKISPLAISKDQKFDYDLSALSEQGKLGSWSFSDLNTRINRTAEVVLETLKTELDAETVTSMITQLTCIKITQNIAMNVQNQPTTAGSAAQQPAQQAPAAAAAKYQVRYRETSPNSEARSIDFVEIANGNVIGTVDLGVPSEKKSFAIDKNGEDIGFSLTDDNKLGINSNLNQVPDILDIDLNGTYDLDPKVTLKDIEKAIKEQEAKLAAALKEAAEKAAADAKKATEEAAAKKQAAEQAKSANAPNADALNQEAQKATEEAARLTAEADAKKAATIPAKNGIDKLVDIILPPLERTEENKSFVGRIRASKDNVEPIRTALKEALKNLNHTTKSEINAGSDENLQNCANAVIRALAEIEVKQGESKGAKFILNEGTKDIASFFKSIANLVQSLWEFAKTGSREPLQNWYNNKPQAIVWDKDKFNDFVNDVAKGENKITDETKQDAKKKLTDAVGTALNPQQAAK